MIPTRSPLPKAGMANNLMVFDFTLDSTQVPSLLKVPSVLVRGFTSGDRCTRRIYSAALIRGRNLAIAISTLASGRRRPAGHPHLLRRHRLHHPFVFARALSG
eukprot:7348767-Prymnesium_polylepis.2